MKSSQRESGRAYNTHVVSVIVDASIYTPTFQPKEQKTPPFEDVLRFI